MYRHRIRQQLVQRGARELGVGRRRDGGGGARHVKEHQRRHHQGRQRRRPPLDGRVRDEAKDRGRDRRPAQAQPLGGVGRAGLSGATDTTERLSLRWTPIPSAVLRLVTHAPIKWRAAALTALMVTALVLLYVSRSPSPVAAPPDAELTSATLDQLLTYPVPVPLNAALGAQRDSALAARQRARRAG